jgi:DNA-directed RNA polymerase specialized sigma24 family protein
MGTTPARPADQDGLQLYGRLKSGDKTTSADIAAAYLDPLIDWLIGTNPTLHPHDCCEAADEAILSLLRNPDGYDPLKLGLFAFLQMSAQGDLKNLLARERRHRRRCQQLSIVELGEDAGKYSGADDDPSFNLLLAEAEAESVPAEVGDGLSEVEKRVLELMLAGERHTEAYAAVMGISDLPVEEQRREVKRVKDRLKKRLERCRQGAGDDSP